MPVGFCRRACVHVSERSQTDDFLSEELCVLVLLTALNQVGLDNNLYLPKHINIKQICSFVCVCEQI